MRLTRVRGVPCESEALGFDELVRGHETCNGVATRRQGIVKLTLNRQAPPPMRRRPVLQLQTQVTSRQTPKARVRKSR